MSSHQPIRTCVGCGQKKLKSELLRIVRTPEKMVEIDVAAKKPGRGAYLCYDVACFSTAIKKGRIKQKLDVAQPTDFYQELVRLVNEKRRQGI
ncbi:MAG: RNase P modulator RnpM [bacterium]